MKRFIISVTLSFSLLSTLQPANAGFLDMLNSLTTKLNSIQNNANTSKNISNPKPALSPRSLAPVSNAPNNKNNSATKIPTSSNPSCSYMLEHSPKNSVVESTAKKVLAGAAMGAAVGALADSKNRLQGAIIGGIVGGAMGVGYSYLTNKNRLLESYDEAAKKLGYNHEGNLLEITKVVYPKKGVKIGQYLPMTLRIAALTPQKPKTTSANAGLVGISVYAYGIKNNQKYYMGEENYEIQEGVYPIYYMLPICKRVKPGTHEIEFRVSGLDQNTYADVRFNVQ